MIEKEIKQLLEKKFEEKEFHSYFLVDIEVNNNRLNVYLDGDQGITLAYCQKISRYLESYLDDKQWKGGKYFLEVSSPGVSRPIVLPRQIIKNIGRDVKLNMKEGPKVEGKLMDYKAACLFVETIRIERQKKKKIKIKELQEIKEEEINHIHVKLNFKSK